LLIGVAGSAAQAPGGLRPAVLITEVRPRPSDPARSPAAVIERLATFDVNANHRISREELPERMQGLVAGGDRNADAALDANEIRALMHAPSPAPIRVSFRARGSDGLPGVIGDLKLAPAKHARAVVIVSAAHPLPFNVDHPASSVLLAQLKALLDGEEYENFVAAATRLSRGADIRFHTVDGSGGVVPQLPGPR